MNNDSILWFEDVCEGDTFLSPGRTVTEADIVNFAGLSGDFHSLHMDATYAASTPNGQRARHGGAQACFRMELWHRRGRPADAAPLARAFGGVRGRDRAVGHLGRKHSRLPHSQANATRQPAAASK